MFFESFTFTREAALFPLFAAAVTITGALMLLGRKYLPGRFREAVSDSSGLFDHFAEDELASSEDGPATGMGVGTAGSEERPKKQVYLVGLVFGYGLLGFLIGLVWATPLFVLAFAVVFKLPLLMKLLLPALGLGIAVAFNLILPTNIGAGLLV